MKHCMILILRKELVKRTELLKKPKDPHLHKGFSLAKLITHAHDEAVVDWEVFSESTEQ